MNSNMPSQSIANEKALQLPDPFLTAGQFQSLFWKPRFLADTPVVEHLPFLFWLTSVLRPQQIRTISANDGVAHFAFCQSLERLGLGGRCIGFGFWGSEQDTQEPASVPERLVEHQETLYDGLSHLVPCVDAESAFERIQPGEIDLLFCDLATLPQGTQLSIDTLLDLLSPKGVLIVHGLEAATEDLTLARNLSRFFASRQHVDLPSGLGLTLCVRHEDVPPPLRTLFDSAQNGYLRSDVELVFRRCGQGLLASARVKALDVAREDAEKSAAAANASAESARSDLSELTESLKLRSATLAEAQTEMYELRSELEDLRRKRDEFDTLKATLEEVQKARFDETARLVRLTEEAKAQLQSTRVELTKRSEQNENMVRISEELRANLAKAQSELEAEKAMRFEETATMVKLAEEIRAKLKETEGDLKTALESKQNLERYQEQLISSTSWRVTAPLRAMKRAIKGN